MRSESLNGERLVTLQHLTGLTQGELAERLNVSGSFLSKITSGTKLFPESLAAGAAVTFGVPESFFYVRTEGEDLGPVTFKKTSAAKARDEKRVVALYGEAARLFRHASAESGYKTSILPRVDRDADPEDVARHVRELAGVLPGAPVKNVTRMTERLGVGVVHTLDPEGHSENAHAGASRPNARADRPLPQPASFLRPADQRRQVQQPGWPDRAHGQRRR